MSNHINDMYWAYRDVQYNQQLLNEGVHPENLRASKKRKKRSDFDVEGYEDFEKRISARDYRQANRRREKAGLKTEGKLSHEQRKSKKNKDSFDLDVEGYEDLEKEISYRDYRNANRRRAKAGLRSEGALADKLHAMNKETKKRWDKEGNDAKNQAYDALNKVKASQDRMHSAMKEEYKNLNRKAGAMGKQVAKASQEAGIRRMGAKAQETGGVRNSVRKAVGLKPKSRPDRVTPGSKEKEERARARAAKMVAVMDKHKPGIAQDQEALNRSRGSDKRARNAKNNIRKYSHELNKEEFEYALCVLIGEGFCDTTTEALLMIEGLADIDWDCIECIFE